MIETLDRENSRSIPLIGVEVEVLKAASSQVPPQKYQCLTSWESLQHLLIHQ
jgi:hypothetical protein